MNFRKGIIDALPIFFGYLSVGFAFGICSIKYGHPMWSPVLMSVTQLSGTGQFAIIDFLHNGSDFWAITLAVFVFNLRYILMALVIAQRLPSSVGIGKRMLIAVGDTDEIVGVAVKQTAPLTFSYMAGLLLCSYAGWVTGTFLAAMPATGALLPPKLIDALGVALYAMFASIVVPEARHRRPIALCVIVAAFLSIGLRLTHIPLNDGWIMLLAGLSSAVFAAVLFPKKETDKKSVACDGRVINA